MARPAPSLSTLRSAGYPNTTQDSLPAAGQALPDGAGYPRGSNERFPLMASPLPQLSWRPPGRPGRLPTSAPHRSGHARLRHPAPRAMNSLRDQTGAPQPSQRQRVTPLQLAETLPRDPGLARAAAEPLVPGTSHVVPEATEVRDIAGDPVI